MLLYVEQELFLLPVHMSSLPVFSEVRVDRSLDFCVVFLHHCVFFCLFVFGGSIVCPSLYGF